MSHAQSTYLSLKALKGLDKVGDILFPGNEEFPMFSHTGCIYHIDELMEHTHANDVKMLNLLLSTLSYAPNTLILFMFNMVNIENKLPHVLGTPFRLLGIALRGVPTTLYYSNLTSPYYTGTTVFDAMKYEVSVNVD